MELIAQRILSYLRKSGILRRALEEHTPYVKKPRVLCKSSPVDPMIKKLSRVVHLPTLSNIHERRINRSMARGALFKGYYVWRAEHAGPDVQTR